MSRRWPAAPGLRLVRRPLGLRQRAVVALAGSGLVLSSFLAAGTYLVAREYLIEQRLRSVTRTAFADAAVARDGLLTAGRPVNEVLDTLSVDRSTIVLLRYHGAWYTTSITTSQDDLPLSIQNAVRAGSAAHAWATFDGDGALVVGTPLAAAGADYYEIRRADELSQTLDTLRAVLAGLTVVTVLVAALLGRRIADQVMRPLDEVASAAGRIAGGDLTARVATTDDPDLAAIVGSFNAMVDTLDERIARDARFAADVSHELRTPLTALVTSVDVLRGRADDLSPTSRRLLDVVAAELVRFRRLLEDLIDLARVEAGAHDDEAESVCDVREVVTRVLDESGRPASLLAAGPPAHAGVDARLLRRALVNLLENAEAHAGGATAVVVRGTGPGVLVHVDDAGPGVPQLDRERVFGRFARLRHRTSTPGSGLGLSLVREIARRSGGEAWCSQSRAGGARFTIRLPAAPAPLDPSEADEPAPPGEHPLPGGTTATGPGTDPVDSPGGVGR